MIFERGVTAGGDYIRRRNTDLQSVRPAEFTLRSHE